MPLAATGIICLGFVPTLGGPSRPLHWFMTAAMVGVGVLLQLRHRLRAREGRLLPVPREKARRAGRALLVVSGVIATLISGTMAVRLRGGAGIGLLSLAMPIIGLAWLASLGLKAYRHADAPEAEPRALSERPSRAPAAWNAAPSAQAPASNRHARA